MDFQNDKDDVLGGLSISFDEQDSALHNASDKELLSELKSRGMDSIYLAMRDLEQTYQRRKAEGLRSSYEA